MTDRLILVLGTPSGGTSAVAGVLHHLGVDMGQHKPGARPYQTFEDRRVVKYAKPTPQGHVTQSIMPNQRDTLRDFRSYCKMRLEEGQRLGKRVGVKIGATVWMGDSDPSTLPIEIVRVTRPLEDSIRSNWQYGGEQSDDAIRRAMQVAGYWAACEELVRLRSPGGHIEVDYYEMLREPMVTIESLCYLLNLSPSGEEAARDFIDPEMRHV